jgi:hypothetical protein
MDNFQIEKEIEIIRLRNSKVEMDKAWETSWARRIFITLITYFIAWVWLVLIHEPKSWLKAFVPVVGYILSTLTLPPLKNWWIKRKTG